MLLAGVLAVGMCISSAACAEESSGSGIKDDLRALLEDETVQDALFGEDGLISGLLPEGTDMQTVEEQIELVESQDPSLSTPYSPGSTVRMDLLMSPPWKVLQASWLGLSLEWTLKRMVISPPIWILTRL